VFGAAFVAVAGAAMAIQIKPAFAGCNTNYWNISCQHVYTNGEGHTLAANNTSQWDTFDYSPYSNPFKAIWTTAGGSWIEQRVFYDGSQKSAAVFFPVSVPNGEKVSCYNPVLNFNILVNCRRGPF
jgi:hypothetical protein